MLNDNLRNYGSLNVSHLQADVTKEVLQLHCEHKHHPSLGLLASTRPPHSVWLLGLLFQVFYQLTLTIQCTGTIVNAFWGKK